MKKKVLFTSLLMATCIATAQETVFSEDFNNPDFNYEGWTMHNLDEQTNHPDIAELFPQGFVWTVLSNNDNPENAFAASTSYFLEEPPVAANRWLVSPPIELPVDADISLSFIDASTYLMISEEYTVYVSTTGTDVVDFENMLMQQIAPLFPEFGEQQLNLSPYAGQTIYLAWQHTTAGGEFLLIDDIVVTANPTAGIEERQAGLYSVYPNPSSDYITVQDKGGLLQEAVLYDGKGHTLREIEILAEQTNLSIEGLSCGIYYLMVKGSLGTSMEKIVKIN